MGFGCPKCSGAMHVTETRPIEDGLRRRRRCMSVECDGRLTTVELTAPTDRGRIKSARGPFTVINSDDFETIRDIVNRPAPGKEPAIDEDEP